MNANSKSGYDRWITLPTDVQSGMDKFIATVKNCLLRGPCIEIVFPAGATSQDWPAGQIGKINSLTFDDADDNGNLYAIFAGGVSGIWTPKYVGTSAREALKNRFKNHLIKKSETTGSVLPKVQREVSNGRKIAIAYVMVEPQNLRRYAEYRVISEEMGQTPDRLCWNKRL